MAYCNLFQEFMIQWIAIILHKPVNSGDDHHNSNKLKSLIPIANTRYSNVVTKRKMVLHGLQNQRGSDQPAHHMEEIVL